MITNLFIFATVLAVVGFCRCKSSEIPFEDIEFLLFGDQPFNELENEILSDQAEADIDADSDLLAEIYPFFSNILKTESTLVDEENWQKKLDKIVKEETDRENVSNEIRNLRREISELKKTVKQLNETLLEKSAVDGMEEKLFNMIKIFAQGDAPLRKYPTLALPTLFNFAPLISNFSPLLNKYTPDLAKESRISCAFADTISDYFKPSLMDRLHQIDVNAHSDRYHKHNKYVFTSEIIKKDFRADGSIMTKKTSIQCAQGEDGDEGYESSRFQLGGMDYWNFGILPVSPLSQPKWVAPDNEFSLVKDSLGKDGVYYREENVEHGNCAPDYFSLVRHRVEKAFDDIFNSVESTCMNDKWKNNKTPTGNMNFVIQPNISTAFNYLGKKNN